MKKVVFLLLYLNSLIVFGQSKTYLDENRYQTRKKNAKYVLVREPKEFGLVVKEFRISDNTLLSEKTLKKFNPGVKDGPYKLFYGNGTLKVKGSYTNDLKSGLWEYYYKGKDVIGNLREKGEYIQDEKTEVWEYYFKKGNIHYRYVIIDDEQKYLQYWGESGDPVLEAGRGVLVEKNDKDNSISTIEFRDSTMYCSFTVHLHDNDTIYDIVTKDPEFTGGYTEFYKNIGRMVKYPASARRSGVSGRVFIQFIVTKNGTLEGLKVLKGIGSGCDEEAVRAVRSSSGNWIPGEFEGKKVKTRLILPVTFKLG